MSSIEFHIAATAFALAVSLGAVFSMLRALFAVRAKYRLRELLRDEARTDARLRVLSEHASAHQLNAAETARALEEIEAHLRLLSETDRALLEPGLKKNTRQGTERFVRDVLARAS